MQDSRSNPRIHLRRRETVHARWREVAGLKVPDDYVPLAFAPWQAYQFIHLWSQSPSPGTQILLITEPQAPDTPFHTEEKEHDMINEGDTIRLTMPLDVEDVFDPSVVHHLPVGTTGRVIDMLGGRAYETEFLIGDVDGEYTWASCAVEFDQCEPVLESTA